jgi:hypothetical protein
VERRAYALPQPLSRFRVRAGCEVRRKLDLPHTRPYLRAMPPRRRTSKDSSPRKLAKRMKRRWRVVLLRAKGEILGEVEAPDVAAAKAAAAVRFELDEIQRNRIMVQELG